MTREPTVDKILIFAKINSSIDSYLHELKSKYPNSRGFVQSGIDPLCSIQYSLYADRKEDCGVHCR